MKQTYRVGIVGVSGYTGVELLRVLDGHPNLHATYFAAGKAAGQSLTDSWPGLTGLLDGPIEAFDGDRCAAACDVVFLALPHGIAARTAPALVDAGCVVVDLGADFRLRDPAQYARYYKQEHAAPHRLKDAVYGLVELNRDALIGARLIANPGCYPTAVTLAGWPLVNAGLAGEHLFADCVSGVSGAGRKPSSRNLYCEVNEAVAAYGVAGSHRHTPEIEQNLGVRVSFTPHLVPMTRGMLATVHSSAGARTNPQELAELYRDTYAGEPMVVVRDAPPSTADARGTNRAHVHVALDEERGVISAFCAIDNLLKGASGQAVQAINVALRLDEQAGLPRFPVMP